MKKILKKIFDIVRKTAKVVIPANNRVLRKAAMFFNLGLQIELNFVPVLNPGNRSKRKQVRCDNEPSNI